MAIVEAKGLTKVYGSGTTTVVRVGGSAGKRFVQTAFIAAKSSARAR